MARRATVYGEQQCTAADTGGHLWTVSQSLADVAPEDWGQSCGRDRVRG
ncbi:MAG: hypothetical protein JOY58_17830 [Solirubrobacterales bacterium]|nr:hypothetical protein [Solirubrobacterales bacterium]